MRVCGELRGETMSRGVDIHLRKFGCLAKSETSRHSLGLLETPPKPDVRHKININEKCNGQGVFGRAHGVVRS